MRSRHKRWTVPWLRWMFKVAGVKVVVMVVMVLIQAAVVDGGMVEDIRAVLPPAQTRRVSVFSGGKLLVEYYNDNTTLCDSWVNLPAGNVWNPALRVVLYFCSLLYTFLGIAIISDIFMSGIEKITSAKEVIKINKETGEKQVVTVTVWNETVANLTLLALGSSAPEILLSVIETVSTLDGVPGELGPSTIVGSAAFNLLCISAVCMYVTEDNKKVKEFGVFIITTVSSVFAYGWMTIVLTVSSECEVTVAEGVLTLCFFPLLVLVSWCQDRNWFRSGRKPAVDQKILSVEIGDGDKNDDTAPQPDARVLKARHQVQELWKHIKSEEAKGNDVLDASAAEAKLAAMAGKESGKAKLSRAVYRMNAVRSAVNRAKQLLPKHQNELKDPPRSPMLSPMGCKPQDNANPLVPHQHAWGQQQNERQNSEKTILTNSGGTLQWSSASYSVLENEGTVRLTIKRTNGSDEAVTVRYHTVDGTAKAGVRYEATSGHLVMEQGEVTKMVEIPIIDDKQYQIDEHFHVVLDDTGGGAELGQLTRAEVTIIDDDQPGVLDLTEGVGIPGDETIIAIETQKYVTALIIRRCGTDGKVSTKVKTVRGNAKPFVDYIEMDTVIEFNHGESEKEIRVPIMDTLEYQKKKTFSIALYSPKGGATIGKLAEIPVVIVEDPTVKGMIDKVVELTSDRAGVERDKLETTSWGEQFRDAMTLDAGDGELCATDYVLHFLTMLWKVIFSIVPPTSVWGGWATFFVALMFIGVVTAIVAEIASLFGCMIGLKDPVTAITFVALGTSLPDTFASKTAIEEEYTADAAIGNVMGSNSVNVFLGLGLPWTIAALYKESKGEVYFYPSSGIVFSVILFLICAVLGICILLYNRVVYGGEMGGPLGKTFSAFLIALWVIYLLGASLQSYGHFGETFSSSSCVQPV
eukprot:TRINITY_DN915_c1_g2_i1.p1 TRINITY_DN915_c1_g2~~TRINITY_DN915_c1_g2_i1.p1  ORF type:complete len:919 (+),score=209.49 TRINITY_DN915_c1_g2_i1:70-2826(+)